MSVLEEFPRQILVDATKSHEAVFVHPDASIYARARMAWAFGQLDKDYADNKVDAIERMGASIKRLKTIGTFGISAGVDLAVETDADDAETDEILLLTSPSNDGRPRSSTKTMVDYVYNPNPGFAQIAQARPNSWDAVTKLDVGHRFSKHSGRPIPMLQLLSRVPPRAMNLAERKQMWTGDYSGFGRIAHVAVQRVNEIRRAEGKKPVQVVHFFGAGIAQRAIGAAAYFINHQTDFNVGSVTAMNLALRRGVKDVAVDHMTQSLVNQPSDIVIPTGHVRIPEPQIRQDIDHRGSDTLQMYGRQLRAILDLSYVWPFMT